MLVYEHNLLGIFVLSVQSAASIGYVSVPIVDPNNLQIVALRVAGRLVDRNADILDTKSIREYSQLGVVIDSIDELVGKDDIVRLGQIIDLRFQLIGIKVITKQGTKLGRVTDYVFSSQDFLILQLIVKRPLVKSFLNPELIITRDDIVEITDFEIIVKDELKTVREKSESTEFVPNFVNPFRKSKPAEAKKSIPPEQ